MIQSILILLRIKDWIKNFIIFFPFLFNLSIVNQSHVYNLIITFFCFSFIASIIYIINDILDFEDDKLHKIKKNIKPLPKGDLTINKAIFILIILILLILILIFFTSFYFHYLAYFLIMMLYNFIFKKIPLIDVLILSAGYYIRLDLGSSVLNVNTSINLAICVISLVSFILFIKRYVEFKSQFYKRKSIMKYNEKTFYFFIFTSALIFVLSSIYFFYFQNLYLMISLPLLILNLIRYFLYSTSNNMGEFPIDVVIKDKVLLINSFIILFIIFFLYQ